MMTTLFAFLHHLAAFTLFAAIAIEFVLLRQEITSATARRLLATDAVLGISATVLLVVGLMRVFFFEKGPDYYWRSHAFLAKFSLFIVAALLSAVPTMTFLSWRKAIRQGQAPVASADRLRTMRTCIHLELAAIVFILLFAAIMARGGWI